MLNGSLNNAQESNEFVPNSFEETKRAYKFPSWLFIDRRTLLSAWKEDEKKKNNNNKK